MTAPYYQIDINANGAQGSWKVSPGGTSLDGTWRSPCRVKALRLANRWEATLEIPLAEMGLPEGKKGNSFL
ncbi:MAG: hypothetical protein IKS20_07695, partial [Victivallales bacterium]|nr:hypothetical protein [Victivallales bacterium]